MHKLNSILKGTLAGLCLLCAVFPALGAESQEGSPAASPADLVKKLEDLQKQIDQLQTEVSAVKGQLGSSTAAGASATETAPTAPAQPSVPAAAPPAEEQAAPANGAQSFLGAINLSGFVDGYYGYNFNHPHSRTTPYRAFDGPANQLSLNMVELILDKTPDAANSRLGFRLALGYGNAMNVVNSTDAAGLGFAQYLKEAYFSYLAPVGKNGLQFDFGKFVTPHGAEVIETKDNWNYSRGLLFAYAIPYYHFGVRTKYSFNSKYALSGYIVNGWNNVVDNNTGKTYGVTFNWAPHPKFSLAQGYMVGPEQADINQNWRQLSDTVVTIAPTNKLSFIVNYDYGRGDIPGGFTEPVYWTGWAGYVRYAFDDRYAMVGRYEWFNDVNGFATGTVQQLKEFTWTLERRIAQRLITRLEYRYDYSNQPTFVKGDLPVGSQSTVAAGLVYVFDSREK
jgi:hypothetical protein